MHPFTTYICFLLTVIFNYSIYILSVNGCGVQDKAWKKEGKKEEVK